MIPIAARNYPVALGIAEAILKHHLPPSFPEPEVPHDTPDRAAYDSREESGIKSSPTG